jgi:transposase-like protein
MVRYTQEQKEEALKRVQELGVAKASEELHISTQTLYKWRNEILIKIKEDLRNEADKAEQSEAHDELDHKAVKDLIDPTVELKARIEALEAENVVLRERNEKMRNLLESMLKAITNA